MKHILEMKCDGLLDMKWNRWERFFECCITPLRPHKVQIVLPDFAEAVHFGTRSAFA